MFLTKNFQVLVNEDVYKSIYFNSEKKINYSDVCQNQSRYDKNKLVWFKNEESG